MPGTLVSPDTAQSLLSLAPIAHVLRTRLGRKPPQPLENLAVRTWEIAPGEDSVAPPARFLPGQLERVTDWAFAAEHPAQAMVGGRTSHAATRAFLHKDVWLIDGSLYKNGGYSWLRPRISRWLPRMRVEHEVDHGAMYCTAPGNQYFGSWLIEDCATYPLACAEGVPVTTEEARDGTHAGCYEAWLGMQPLRLRNAFFRELVIFEDVGQNRHKHRRFRAMSERLLAHVKVQAHPGIFILRGASGERRLLHNELELAERLRRRRGFRILDPMTSDVPSIVAACAGARTLVGIEGSHLAHGMLALPPGGSLLTLQPPNRFVRLYKDMTDRDHQHFGFVVGQPDGDGFRVDPDEVERTLDLLPA